MRKSLEPLVRLVVMLPRSKLRDADRILDMYIDGKLSHKEALRKLRRLASP